jgi:hypothetical protein
LAIGIFGGHAQICACPLPVLRHLPADLRPNPAAVA